jgi:hypothetical protein
MRRRSHTAAADAELRASKPWVSDFIWDDNKDNNDNNKNQSKLNSERAEGRQQVIVRVGAFVWQVMVRISSWTEIG